MPWKRDFIHAQGGGSEEGPEKKRGEEQGWGRVMQVFNFHCQLN